MNRMRFIPLMCALYVLSIPSVEANAAEGGMDIVLAIDTSGSMKKTDPRNLRAEAAKLFIHLLGQDDRVALVTFDTTARVLSDLKGAKDDRTFLLDQLRHVTSDGKYTNLHEAIRCSRDLLKTSTKKSRAVIVMTDGKTDLGDPEKDRDVMQQLRDQSLPSLKTEGIRVFAIAFTEFSDIQFLKRIAFITDGFFYLTQKDEDLHVTFTDIYDHLTAPDSLPIDKEEFYVDRAVQELDIVITKADPLVGVALEMPDRRSLTFQKHPGNVRWHQSKAFEMISVSGPLVGAWRIQYGAEKGNRVFVLTNLRLMTSFQAGVLPPDSEVKLEAWLHEGPVSAKRAPVRIHDLRVTAEIVPKGEAGASVLLYDDATHGDDQAGDGVYTARIKPERRGEHLLTLQAHGLTFEREKHLAFYVPEEELEDAWVPPAADPPAHEEPARPVVEERPPEPAPEGVDWGSVFVRFLMVNAVLALGVSAGLLWRRRAGRSKGSKAP